ncbi:MAG: hypothetical protein IJQ39_03190 [Thermoguttaceae bacterium]|nr:hypothetical protein [Thermoguttaceae bacterium]
MLFPTALAYPDRGRIARIRRKAKNLECDGLPSHSKYADKVSKRKTRAIVRDPMSFSAASKIFYRALDKAASSRRTPRYHTL